MKLRKKLAAIVSAATLASALTGVIPMQTSQLTVQAAASYPVQKFRLGMYNTNQNVNSSGTSLAPAVQNGTEAEKWTLNYISSGVYEIVNSSTGQILTANGSGVSLAADSDGSNQRWNIEGVEKGYDDFYLYYKITSNADKTKALTFTDGSGFGLASYSGADYQKYKLNLDGLEGFAGDCMVNGKEKAGTIGGLLGETVFCDTIEEVTAALDSTEPKTVVLTANLDFVNTGKDKQRIRDNKTLVGSYAANTITDCQMRNDDLWGEEDTLPSGNIVIRNINFRGDYLNSKNSGNIYLSFYGVRNLWLDHNSFSADYDQNKNSEVGKFVWINTPAMGWSDDKWNAYNPDYITASYNSFNNRYWTFAFGSQNTDTSRLHTTLMYNRWEQCSRRCPQYSNGYDHNYNNYHTVTGSSNPNASSQVIGGEGSRVINENCRFEGYTRALDPDRNLCISFTDKGSYTADSPTSTVSPISFENHNSDTWKVADCYGYNLVEAYNTKNTDIKAFCNKYSGSFSSESGLKYITDSDMSGWIKESYTSPCLKEVEFSTALKAEVFNDGATYMIKNANSNLYIDIDGAKAANGTNAQQWGATEAGTQNTFKLVSAGEGYYYIVSAVGDGGTYVLDIAGKKTADGTNVDIYQYNGGDNQKFMFTKNADGTYKIRTKITDGKSAIEVADGAANSGANVQQWSVNGANCQDWYLEPVTNPGCVMDTSVIYKFKNVNSGLMMDIANGTMEDGTNLQQWGSGTYDNQKWTLKAFAGGGNYYYICSVQDSDYVLKSAGSENGANIYITPYSTKDSAMLFKFSKNPDGSYNIMTRASKDAAYVEVASASTSNGANVQQWAPTNNTCQNWVAETQVTTTVTTTTTTTTTTTSAPTKPTTTTEKMTTVITTTTVPVTTVVTTTTPVDEAVTGDINKDGAFSVADIIILQKYLISATDTLGDAKAADIIPDGKINVFDLVAIKRLFLSK